MSPTPSIEILLSKTLIVANEFVFGGVSIIAGTVK